MFSFEPTKQTFAVAPFEHYMAADDSAQFPMNILWQLEFVGELDSQILADAVKFALKLHPLLNSKFNVDASHRLSQLRWEPAQTIDPIITWISSSWLDAVQQIQPIELSRERALRIFAKVENGRSRLLIQAHHSATDGQGISAFIEDMMRSYAGLTPRKAPDEIWDNYRISLGLDKVESIRRLPSEIKHACESIFQPALPVHAPKRSDETQSEVPFRGSMRINFSAEQVATLKESVRPLGATLNDLLLMAFFQSLSQWNLRYGGKHKRIRVSVPVNLRPENSRFAACNMVGMCFLNRKPHVVKDKRKLIESIRNETQDIRKKRLGLTLVRTIHLASRARLGKAYNAGGDKRCHATGVLTNLGKVFAKTDIAKSQNGKLRLNGDLILDRVSTYPPIRPNTPLTIGAITYAGELGLCLSYDRGEMSNADAQQFMETFKGILLQPIDTTS